MDGASYWFHLLSFASPEARKDFSDQIAFAESLVLTSFAGALVAVLHILLLTGFAGGSLFPDLVARALQVGPGVSATLLAFGVGAWVVFYQAALPAHREAGRMLRALIDTGIPSLLAWPNKVQAPLDADTAKELEKLRNYLAEPSSASR